MALTYDEVIQIYKDLMRERPPSVPGPEAEKFAKELRVEMDEIIIKGGAFDIPKEL